MLPQTQLETEHWRKLSKMKPEGKVLVQIKAEGNLRTYVLWI